MDELAPTLEPRPNGAIESRVDRARQIIDAAGEAFVSIDADGRIVEWNREAELVFGWPRKEAIGRRLAGTVLPPREEEAGPSLARFLATGEGADVSRRIEMLAQHRDGYPLPVELSIAPVLGGEELTYAIFLRDITDRRQIERRLEEAELESLRRLALAAEYRDTDSAEHTRRVARLAGLIAARLRLDPATVRLIEQAAPFHDVGKLAIPDAILYKPGWLTYDEFDVVKRHTTVGAAILCGRESPLLEMARQIALTHHERWDGTGYPDGLAQEAIPISGRIVSVADVFDALTHRRPYKPAWPRQRALHEIRAQSGRQFDPQVVETFLQVEGPPGERGSVVVRLAERRRC